MSIVLYHNDKSTCSQKVRLCLAELGLEWRDRHIDLMAQENLGAEYLAINPNGVVPALTHNGGVVIESTVMCEYLCEVFDDPENLLPATALGRAEVRAWLRYIDEVPSMAVRVPTFEIIKTRFEAMSAEEYADFAERNPLRRDFFERLGQHGFSERDRTSTDKQLSQTVARMERAIAKGGWIAGGAYSLADICAVPVFQRLEDIGQSQYRSNSSSVTDWFERIKSREAYGRAFYAGSLFSDPPRQRAA